MLRYMYRKASQSSFIFISNNLRHPLHLPETPHIHKSLKFYRTLSSISIVDRVAASLLPTQEPTLVFSSSSTSGNGNGVDFPKGEFDFVPHSGFKKFIVKVKTLLASEHVEHGSILRINLQGNISDGPVGTDSKVLSLPQLSENLMKAAFDPRVSAVFLYIGDFYCGWAKCDEIRRQISNFKKSGKKVIAFVPLIVPKTYYIASECDEIYAPSSASVCLFGITMHNVTPPNVCKHYEDSREAVTALLDHVYSNWLDQICCSRGKTRENVENLLNQGIYLVHKLKEEGFLTDILYQDQVFTCLEEKLGVQSIHFVNFRDYSLVGKSTVGIETDEENLIAIIRVSGTINSNKYNTFMHEMHSVMMSKKFKALIIRIDCPGGSCRLSELMWKETTSVASKIPVVASLSDVATGGGYYIAIGANVVVSENLSFTGSIGVASGNINLDNLYQRIDVPKLVSLAKALKHSVKSPTTHEQYIQFRNNAAFSRSMTIKNMESIAQGKVWTGKDAASHGLVDAIGGMSCAIAIAKLQAKIPQDSQVTLVELSKHNTKTK